MFGQLVGEISFSGVLLKFGEYLSDSCQEHTATSDDCLFVSASSFDSAISFPKFGVFFGIYQSVGNLYKERLQKGADTGYFCGFYTNL